MTDRYDEETGIGVDEIPSDAEVQLAPTGAPTGELCHCGRPKGHTGRHIGSPAKRNPESSKLPTRKGRPQNIMPKMEMDFGPMARFIDQSIAIYQRKIDALIAAKKAVQALQE